MKTIKLTQNQVALVDDADYNWLNQWKWYACKLHGNFYAARQTPVKNNKQITIYMHRLILGLNSANKKQGDHKNCNTLDNRRNNLRICTTQENQMNRGPDSNSTSLFKGVSWHKGSKKWRVQISINGERKHLGYFHNEIFAATIYDNAAKKHYGEFAHLNFN